MSKRKDVELPSQPEESRKKLRSDDEFSAAQAVFSSQPFLEDLKSVESKFKKPDINAPKELSDYVDHSSPPLYKAIVDNNVGKVAQLLTKPQVRETINTGSNNFSPPLFWAVKLYFSEIIDLLWQNGADIKQLNSKNYSCLNFAFQCADSKVLNKLFAHSPNLLQTNNVMRWIDLVDTAFKYGTSGHLIRIAEHILSSKDEKSLYIFIILLRCKGCHSLKPLTTLKKFKSHFIAMIDQDKPADFLNYLMRGDKKLMLNLLSSKKIKRHLLEWKSEKDFNIIHIASEANRKDILKKIYSLCPTLFSSEDKCYTNTFVFVQLIRDGHLSVLKKIFEEQPELLNKIDSEGRVNAIFATGWERLDILSYLKKHSRWQLYHPQQDGKTPLINAVEHGHLSAVKWFYQEEKDHFIKWRHFSTGRHIGHYSAEYGKIPILDFLLSTAPDLLDRTDEDGFSPFLDVLRKENLEALKWFLKQKPGLERSWSNKNYNTHFLHHVAGWDALEILDYLYNDCKIPLQFFFHANQKGYWPVVYALQYKNLNILKWFHEHVPQVFEWELEGRNLLNHVFLKDRVSWSKSGDHDIDILWFFHQNYPYLFGRLLVKLVDSNADSRQVDQKILDLKPQISLIKVDSEIFLHVPKPQDDEYEVQLLKHPVLDNKLLPIPGVFDGVIDAKTLPIELTREILFKNNLFALLRSPITDSFNEIKNVTLLNYMSIFSLPPQTTDKCSLTCREDINLYIATYFLLKGISYQLKSNWVDLVVKTIMEYCVGGASVETGILGKDDGITSSNARIAALALWDSPVKVRESIVMDFLPDIERHFDNLSMNVDPTMSDSDLKKHQQASADKIVELAALAWTKSGHSIKEANINKEKTWLCQEYESKKRSTPAAWCYPFMAQSLFTDWQRRKITPENGYSRLTTSTP